MVFNLNYCRPCYVTNSTKLRLFLEILVYRRKVLSPKLRFLLDHFRVDGLGRMSQGKRALLLLCDIGRKSHILSNEVNMDR